MTVLSRHRRIPPLAQQHHRCSAFPRHIAIAALILLLALVHDMCGTIQHLRVLQKRTNFADALRTTHRIPRRQFWNKRATLSDRSFSTVFPANTLPSTASRISPFVGSNNHLTRLFGSKRGVPENPLGTVSIYNDQDAIQDIDEAALRTTVERISKILGYETYDVTLLLVDDEEMRETNLESRGIDSPTDILSFPFHEPVHAGLLEEPEFDVPDYYTLGDMVVCVPYVIRRTKEDMDLPEDERIANYEKGDDGSSLAEEADRGVSGAMAFVPDPERRIRMLLVHGMLHLVGYDHIEDDDYIEMVEREEELLKELGELE